MRGPLIETEARKILNEGIAKGVEGAQEEIALRMLQAGKLTVKDIVGYTGMKTEKLEELIRIQKLKGTL